MSLPSVAKDFETSASISRRQGGIVFFVMPICELRSDWAYTPAGSELRHLKVHGDGWPHLRGRSNLGRKSSEKRL